jgi:uncharacterized protein (TIRG00374 family)
VTRRPRTARTVQLALAVAGLALFVGLVHGVGRAQLADDLRRFGWSLVAVVALELLVDACNTAAWRRTLPPDAPVGYWLLYWVRQAGVAINQLTPTATVGGEIAKTMLLRPRLPTATTAASLVAARMSYALGQAILVLLGLSVILTRTRATPDLGIAMIGAFTATVVGVGAFVWLQRRGVFGPAIARARRLGIARTFVDRLHAGGVALDRQLAAYYRNRPYDFGASVLWHVVGQLVSLAQLWFILTALGVPTGLTTCLAIEAFAVVIDSATFFVPGRLGVQEAGRVVAFTTFGLDASTGLAVAIIVRLTQLLVAGVGMAAFGALSLAPPKPRPSDPSASPDR